MKKLILFLCFSFVFPAFLAAETPLIGKTACHWYLPNLPLEQAQKLVKYDLLIVDPECIFTSRASLDFLRQSHPGIKIICYFNPVEWFNPMFPDKPWSLCMVASLNEKPEWWLKGTDQKRITFWPGMQTMNCCWDCPTREIGGQKVNYVQFITTRFIKDVLKKYAFDGVLLDNLWNRVDWLGNYGQNRHGLDRDGDGKDDAAGKINQSWKTGLAYVAEEIRDFGGSDFIVIGNPANLDYQPYCSGKMFENFPDIYCNEEDKKYQAWYENLDYARAFPGPCVFNARADNYFFTLCSSLLLDNVYFSFQQNSPYDPKWELNLGEPLCPAEDLAGAYKRCFKNGNVFVDPGAKKAWIVYKDGRERKE